MEITKRSARNHRHALGEKLARIASQPHAGQYVIMPIDKAFHSEGHFAIRTGNLAEGRIVAKISGQDHRAREPDNHRLGARVR